MKVTSPDGKITNQDLQEIEGSRYLINDYNNDDILDHRITIPSNQSGISYSIEVIPEDYAASTDTFTLIAREGNAIITLADNERIENISTQPYTFITTNIVIKMPKKKKKGKNAKSKNVVKAKRELLFAEDMQEYAVIDKLLGDRRVTLTLIDGTNKMGIIPGRFRKRNCSE